MKVYPGFDSVSNKRPYLDATVPPGPGAATGAEKVRTLDLPLATEVPGGHGHKYTAEYVDAWATVLQPADWTEAKASRLQEIVAGA